MKLRFSDGIKTAVEFYAINIQEFKENGLQALAEIIPDVQRRIHRGEIHKTVVRISSIDLHYQLEGFNNWLNLGVLKTVELQHIGGGGKYKFFEPSPYHLPCGDFDSLDNAIVNLQWRFLADSMRVWDMCLDTERWAENFNLTFMRTGDEIQRLTDK